MRDYTPKKTPYRGVTYRSRLEATWAAFFLVKGIEYQYEPFQVAGIYTPDFLLGTDPPTLVEIKPAKNKLELVEHKKRCEYVEHMPILLLGRAPRVGGFRWADGMWTEVTYSIWGELGGDWSRAMQDVTNELNWCGIDRLAFNQKISDGLRLPRG